VPRSGIRLNELLGVNATPEMRARQGAMLFPRRNHAAWRAGRDTGSGHPKQLRATDGEAAPVAAMVRARARSRRDVLSRRKARELSEVMMVGNASNYPLAGGSNTQTVFRRLTPELSRATKWRRLE